MVYQVSGGGNSSCDRCIHNDVLVDWRILVPCGECIRANCNKHVPSEELRNFYGED